MGQGVMSLCELSSTDMAHSHGPKQAKPLRNKAAGIMSDLGIPVLICLQGLLGLERTL